MHLCSQGPHLWPFISSQVKGLRDTEAHRHAEGNVRPVTSSKVPVTSSKVRPSKPRRQRHTFKTLNQKCPLLKTLLEIIIHFIATIKYKVLFGTRAFLSYLTVTVIYFIFFLPMRINSDDVFPSWPRLRNLDQTEEIVREHHRLLRYKCWHQYSSAC